MLHYQLFWKVDTIICHKYAIRNCFQFLCGCLLQMMMFIMKSYIGMALPVLFWQYQPWIWWVKTKNFYSSNSYYQRCNIFTSRYMFSKQAKAKELVRNTLSVSKTPKYPIWPPFLQKMVTFQTISILIPINGETNALICRKKPFFAMYKTNHVHILFDIP